MNGGHDFAADLDRLRLGLSPTATRAEVEMAIGKAETEAQRMARHIKILNTKGKDWRTFTHDMSVNYDGTIFKATGRKTKDPGDGFCSKNALVRFADGTVCYAVVDLCHEDSGEHYGTLFFVPHDGGQVVDHQTLIEVTGKKQADLYPYKYKYTGQPLASDHHVGDDGWSL